MFRIAMICLLAAVSAAQTTNLPKVTSSQPSPAPVGTPPAASSTPAPATSVATAVPDTAAVITLHGLCPAAAPRTATKTVSTRKTAASSPAPCVTTITKGELEKLLGVLNTNNQPISPQVLRQFSQNYVELLTYADAAKKAGTEDANFAELMRFVRLRTLVSVYRQRLEEQYRKPPEKDIETYYKNNAPKYEEIKLSRIFIPAKNPAAQDKDAWEKKAAELAADIHDRAAKGEDLEKMQKEAYTTLGLTTLPPPTSMGTRRRGMLPQAQEQELFALRPGDVSKLDQEAAGYTIYKVESKDTVPLDKVKEEISRELGRESMEAKTKQINAGVHADFNENFFGPPPAAPASMVPPGGIKVAPQSQSATPSAGAKPLSPQPQPASSPAPASAPPKP